MFRNYLLCGIGLVVHEKEFDVAGVVDEESLVAGGHHVASLLVGSETNLRVLISHCPHPPGIHGGRNPSSQLPPCASTEPFCVQHTDGITIWPLNRLRTRLSIPLGLRQLASTHM